MSFSKKTKAFLWLFFFLGLAGHQLGAMEQAPGLLMRATSYIISSRLGACFARLGSRIALGIKRGRGVKKLGHIVYTAYTRERIEAHMQDDVAGRIEFEYQTDIHDKKVVACEIKVLEVEPAYRNKGIGKELLQQAIKHLATRGAESVSWESSPFGRRALTQEQLNAFYARQGGLKKSNNMFEYRIKQSKMN